MRRLLISVLLMFAATLVGGCGKSPFSEPVIDASTNEKMRASIEEVRASIPAEEAEKFDEALQVLAFSQIDIGNLFAEGAVGAGSVESKMRQALDGKTASEVMAEAERVKAKRAERRRQEALLEIEELEQKRQEQIRARDQLNQFEVLQSRFYKRDDSTFREAPVIELTVVNNTEHAVSKAYFNGIIASPGRSVPWLEESFSYSISGGLEPGEEAGWSLAPNPFSEWGRVEASEDAIFTVTVEQLDGADGEALFDARSFSERQAKRLDELRSQYGDASE